MKILLFGGNGQVGWELQRSLAPLGDVIAVDFNSIEYCGDFCDPVGIVDTVRRIKPNVIVNAAAYTAVDKAESEQKLSLLINATSVEALAKEAQSLNAWMIHYSTDYIFSGRDEKPWKETDKPAPLNVYGETKLLGEKAIQKKCINYLIFRTSWVFGFKGNNFVKTILRLAKEKSVISIINDQYGAPTSAELIADCTAHAILKVNKNPNYSGVYHLTASGITTWFEYAQLIVNEAKNYRMELALQQIIPVLSDNYPTIARRPKNSRLNTNKFQKTFDLSLPNWDVGVKRILTELFSK